MYNAIWDTGDVNWLDRVNATNKRLAFVNSAGNAILKVDNVTDIVYLDKRDSVVLPRSYRLELYFDRCFIGSNHHSEAIWSGQLVDS